MPRDSLNVDGPMAGHALAINGNGNNPMIPLIHLYGQALLNLIWLTPSHGTGANAGRGDSLVLGVTELFPWEVPAPILDRERSQRLNDELSVHCRSTSLSAEHAVSWHVSALKGSASRPSKDAQPWLPLATSDLNSLTPWPRLSRADRHCMPFIQAWQRNPRSHHALSDRSPNDSPLFAKLSSFVADQYGFSLEDWHEILGSVHLIAINPLFRRIDVQRGADARSIKVRLRARRIPPGVTPPPLVLTALCSDCTGESRCHQSPISLGEWLTLSVAAGLHSVALYVTDSEGTVLDSASFELPERAIVFEHWSYGKDDVVRPMRGKKPEKEYRVRSPTKPIISRLGADSNTEHDRARLILAGGVDRRARAATKQRWFYRQQKEAEDYIRSLIRDARKSIAVIDPYFSYQEVKRFLYAPIRFGVTMRILTSDDAFVLDRAAHPKMLQDELDMLAKSPLAPIVECKKVPSDDIHDRFLCIDDAVYSLGGSLNRYGSTGMMALLLPNPAPMLAWFNGRWRLAQSLATSTASTTGGGM